MEKNYNGSSDVLDYREGDYDDVLKSPVQSSTIISDDNSIKSNVNSTTLGKINRDSVQSNHSNQNTPLFNKMDTFKHWSVCTLKFTKQFMGEKLGIANVTRDSDLNERIHSMRIIQNQYKELLNLTDLFIKSLKQTLNHQRAFSSCLSFLGVHQSELNEEFILNAESQRMVVSNGEILLEYFENMLQTLIERTFADTWEKISLMELARIKYDAFNKQKNNKRTNDVSTDGANREQDERQFEEARERYLELKTAVEVKLRFLDDNRLRVMKYGLPLLHNASTAFYSGDYPKLEQLLSQYKLKTPNPKL